MKRTLLVVFCIFFNSLMFGQKSMNTLFQEGTKAYQDKDYGTFLEKMREIDDMRPNHPTVVYRLAQAYALNGRKTRSIQKLRQLILMDATRDFENDPELASLKGYKGYDKLIELRSQLTETVENDEVFRTIDAGAIHPESFVLLENGDLLLGSIREKKIVKVTGDGTIIDWLEAPFSVLGMKPDYENDLLWVATAAMPQMLEFSKELDGQSMVLQVNLSTGEIYQGISYDEESLIGDLVADSQARLWLSNSKIPYISRDDTDTTSYQGSFVRKQYDLGGSHYNIQGLSLTDDEKFLYFADYVNGLHRVRIEDDDISRVQAGRDFMMKGIDGLYYYKNTLIAIHNGIKPFRIMQYQLDESGRNVIGQKIINRGGGSLGEPTLGQIKDGYFYYLANSPWGAYDQQMNLDAEKVRPIEIRRYKLEE